MDSRHATRSANIPDSGGRGQAGRRGRASTGAFRVRPFRAAPWLPGGHLQTMGGRVLRALRPAPASFYRRERLETPDGDFVDLDHAQAAEGPIARSGRRHASGGPFALVLHGLGGSSGSGYAMESCRALGARGIRPIVLNFRSCSGEPNRRMCMYHSGETGDLEHVVRHLARAAPGAPFAILGFSLGANVLLKWLGERGSRLPPTLRAAAAVSVPFDLAACASHLERPAGRPYTAYLLHELQRGLRAKARLFPDAYDLARGLRARTLRAFDEVVTAPVHGFVDAEDYYRQSSSGPYLGRIRLPTLLLHAEDDPFVAPESIPRAAIGDNPWLVDEIGPAGGHVGFVDGRTPGRFGFWSERETARFVAAHLGAPEPGPDATPGDCRGGPASATFTTRSGGLERRHERMRDPKRMPT